LLTNLFRSSKTKLFKIYIDYKERMSKYFHKIIFSMTYNDSFLMKINFFLSVDAFLRRLKTTSFYQILITSLIQMIDF
jgi:hypothetical protein